VHPPWTLDEETIVGVAITLLAILGPYVVARVASRRRSRRRDRDVLPRLWRSSGPGEPAPREPDTAWASEAVDTWRRYTAGGLLNRAPPPDAGSWAAGGAISPGFERGCRSLFGLSPLDRGWEFQQPPLSRVQRCVTARRPQVLPPAVARGGKWRVAGGSDRAERPAHV